MNFYLGNFDVKPIVFAFLIANFFANSLGGVKDELIFKIANHSIPHWMYKEARKTLLNFGTISAKSLDLIKNENNYPLVRFKIKNNNVNVMFLTPGARLLDNRLQILRRIFNELKDCVTLPNIDFIVNLGDCFLGDGNKFTFPVFAFSKNRFFDTKVLLIPDVGCLNDYNVLLEQVAVGIKTFPYKQKINKAIWRGATTGGNFTVENFLQYPRGKLVALSSESQGYIDAKFHFVCQNDLVLEKEFLKLGYLGKFMSVSDHLKFKYQLLVDGITCAWTRAYWQMFSNSLILKQESDNVQWYYSELIPFVHYVPVKGDFSDLIEKIVWANQHEKEVAKIISNANRFAREHLSYGSMLLYFYVIFKEYSRFVV